MSVGKTLAVAGAVLSLGACGQPESPSAPVEPASAPPAPAPAPAQLSGVDLSKPIRALGTEPFWGLDVSEAGGLVLTGVDRPEIKAPSPRLETTAARAVFTGRTADGGDLVLTLTPGPCSDGMSDRTYPLTAAVVLADETLKGCAASTEALARAGESGEVR